MFGWLYVLMYLIPNVQCTLFTVDQTMDRLIFHIFCIYPIKEIKFSNNDWDVHFIWRFLHTQENTLYKNEQSWAIFNLQSGVILTWSIPDTAYSTAVTEPEH